MIYITTYNDFLKKLKESGLQGRISDYDMSLAEINPDAGIAIIDYKNDYLNAETEQQRSDANAGAEQIRSLYGSYTAGKDGMGYNITDLYDNADELYAELKTRQDYSYDVPMPVYSSKYADKAESKLEEIEKKQKAGFSYNPEDDAVYSAYRKQYIREGNRAAENAYGIATQNTAGQGSSYASSAAMQTLGQYNAALTDKIPELYSDAYQRFGDDIERESELYKLYAAAEQAEYQRYLDSVKQYNTDREFDYKVYSDDIDNDFELLDNALEIAKQKGDYELEKTKLYNQQKNNEAENELQKQKLEQNASIESQKRKLEQAELEAKYGNAENKSNTVASKVKTEDSSDNEADDAEDNTNYSINPNYAYVKGYGYMKWSTLKSLMAEGKIGRVLDPDSKQYYYYYTD